MPAVYGSDLEKTFAKAWLAHCPGIPAPVTQYSEIGPWVDYLYEVRKKAKPRSRKWRADFCWPDQQIVLEVQGGAFSGGRHTRGVGFRTDMQKSLLLQSSGWLFLALTADMISQKDGHWILQVRKAVESRLRLLVCC